MHAPLLGAGALAALLGLAAPVAAAGKDVPPTLALSLRDTLDLWDDADGGLRPGGDLLNKLQLGGTLATDRWGWRGFSAHVQIFRTDGRSLSARVGDIQTVDSIDARPVTRLFESWIEQKVGDDDRSAALRLGLIDLNSDFDSIQTAGLFTNSSHGIAADLARSGRNGPSIYPVSALAARLTLVADRYWTFRIAAFDGVPGDPARPHAFVAARLAPGDGALLIAQADYHLGDKAKIEGGIWHYGARVPAIGPGASANHDQGAYVSIEGPLAGSDVFSGWARAGIADAQTVGGYLGGGIVAQGLIRARPQDRLGLAVAHAIVAGAARRLSGLPAAETSVELSYQYKLRETIAFQPDAQYIVHPASAAHIANALVIGLRIMVTAGYPKQAPAAEATDPSVPPDGPAPDTPS